VVVEVVAPDLAPVVVARAAEPPFFGPMSAPPQHTARNVPGDPGCNPLRNRGPETLPWRWTVNFYDSDGKNVRRPTRSIARVAMMSDGFPLDMARRGPLPSGGPSQTASRTPTTSSDPRYSCSTRPRSVRAAGNAPPGSTSSSGPAHASARPTSSNSALPGHGSHRAVTHKGTAGSANRLLPPDRPAGTPSRRRTAITCVLGEALVALGLRTSKVGGMAFPLPQACTGLVEPFAPRRP